MRGWRRATTAASACLLAACTAWSMGAACYAPRGPAWLGPVLAVLVLVSVVACVLALRWRAAFLSGSAACCAVLAWWLALAPSNSRDWAPEYALAATARQEGGRILLGNVRDATYSAGGGISLSYYDAEFRLDRLDEVDLVSSHWSDGAVAHVFLSFGFSNGRHVAMSVETRRERDEPYSVLAGFFRRYELIYVVADERDLIGVRTDVRRESVYLYRLQTTLAERQALFLSYVGRIAKLAEAPEFYNTATNNCTTNVLGRANDASGGATSFASSWMVLLSGYADRYAYELGWMDRRLPFAELKGRSLIRRSPDARPGPGYPAGIRQGLPGWDRPA